MGPKVKLIQALMVVLVTYKNDEDQSKNELTRVLTTFLPFQVYRNFSRHFMAANSTDPYPILPNFKPIQDFISVLATCKNEDDPIKNEGAIVITTLCIDFSDTQGQLTQ